MSKGGVHQIEGAVAALLAKVEPAERRRLMLEIARELRRSQSARIAAQRNPDGGAYAPRKRRGDEPLRAKGGRIRRKAAGRAMFRKIRSARYLKAEATAQEAAVGFTGRVARIARVHQEGGRDQVSKTRSAIYPKRELLGLTDAERGGILDAVLRRLEA